MGATSRALSYLVINVTICKHGVEVLHTFARAPTLPPPSPGEGLLIYLFCWDLGGGLGWRGRGVSPGSTSRGWGYPPSRGRRGVRLGPPKLFPNCQDRRWARGVRGKGLGFLGG